MKHLIIVIAAFTALAASAQTGVDAMAKQRAKDVANQNNNRTMEPPGAASAAGRPAAPAAPTITTTPASPAQRAFGNFQAVLLTVNSNSTPDAKQTLAKDMANVAQGANKPSQATLSKFSDHLTTALSEAKLTTQKKIHLAQDVGVLLNSANTPPTQKTAMIQDVESILKTGGTSSDNAAAVAADLQTITDEVMKPAAK